MKEITTNDKSYEKAKVIVLQDKNCSTSYLQRTMGIGYNRASLIIGLLEKNNVISSPDKNGIRTII